MLNLHFETSRKEVGMQIASRTFFPSSFQSWKVNDGVRQLRQKLHGLLQFVWQWVFTHLAWVTTVSNGRKQKQGFVAKYPSQGKKSFLSTELRGRERGKRILRLNIFCPEKRVGMRFYFCLELLLCKQPRLITSQTLPSKDEDGKKRGGQTRNVISLKRFERQRLLLFSQAISQFWLSSRIKRKPWKPSLDKHRWKVHKHLMLIAEYDKKYE